VLWIRDVSPDPGSRLEKIPDPDPHKRMLVFLTQEIVSKLLEK
jgi:hypothetical protein